VTFSGLPGILLLFAIFNGLSVGAAVFLVAAGLTFVFGILRVLNFAHGHFFMIGAWIAFSIIGKEAPSLPVYLLASLVAGVAVGALGIVTDFLVLRRLRNVDHAYMMIATFALLMVASGASKLIWGQDTHSVSPPEAITGGFSIGDLFVPGFSLFILCTGVAVFVLLEVVMHRLWIGKLIRSVAHDAWMSGQLGINVAVLYTGAVVLAFFLAGLAGGLLLPNQGLSHDLAFTYLLHGFVAIIIGGLGSIRGAFIASMAMGLTESIAAIVFPNIPGLTIYIVMVAFLLFRPQGLFGQQGHA
jgi:branched-chain amino acid transport system permease protein